MNKIFFLTTVILSLLFASCTKKETGAQFQLDGGAINIANTVIGGSTITLMTTPGVVSNNNQIGMNNYNFMPIISGQVPVIVGVPAVDKTATSPAVPAVIYYNQTIAVDKTSNYSLFLTGSSPAAVDNILIKENYTRTYSDSVFAVRVINLSPGNNPVSVNIKNNANGSEISTLSYKAYSDFKQYAAKKANGSYIFEFRDAVAGTLLATYPLATPYFHNVTLCFRGKVGGSPAPGITLVNNF